MGPFVPPGAGGRLLTLLRPAGGSPVGQGHGQVEQFDLELAAALQAEPVGLEWEVKIGAFCAVGQDAPFGVAARAQLALVVVAVEAQLVARVTAVVGLAAELVVHARCVAWALEVDLGGAEASPGSSGRMLKPRRKRAPAASWTPSHAAIGSTPTSSGLTET